MNETYFWKAKTISISEKKVNFTGIDIACADAAISLAEFVKKMEKLKIDYDIFVYYPSFETKEEVDELAKSILKFPNLSLCHNIIINFRDPEIIAVERPTIKIKDESPFSS